MLFLLFLFLIYVYRFFPKCFPNSQNTFDFQKGFNQFSKSFQANPEKSFYTQYFFNLIMPTAVKEVNQSDSTITLVLASQKELEVLVKEIKRLITKYSGQTGHWNSILRDIVGDDEQGMMQKLIAVQGSLRALPNIVYSSELQRIAAYLGDEFNFLDDINRLITSELVFAKEKGTANALLDEIGRLCDFINARIRSTRTEVANVPSAL